MSGKLTLPEELPPPDRLQSWLLPVADRFMTLMLSRPPGGSLRTARVTPMTIWLAAGVFVVAGIPGLLLTGYALLQLQLILLLAGLVLVGLGLGSAALAVFGIRQRQGIAAHGHPQGQTIESKK